MRHALNDFFWVSLEGTDAVGKSSVIGLLKKQLQKRYPDLQIVLFEEFSDSPIGRLIRELVRKRYAVRLLDKQHLPIAETLLLSADYIYQLELFLAKRKGNRRIVLITDRGPYSFFTYQLSRLNKKYNHYDWSQWISQIFKPLKKPDLAICLTADHEILKSRVRKRGKKTSVKRMKFIFEMQNTFIRIFRNKKNHFIINNKNRPLSVLVDKLDSIVSKSVRNKKMVKP